MNLRLKELYTLYSVQELAEHCLHEESENEILNNRINKAIEYINKCNKEEKLRMYVDTWQHLYPILNILNGGDEE